MRKSKKKQFLLGNKREPKISVEIFNFFYKSKWLLQCKLNRNTITIIKEIAFVHVCDFSYFYFRQMQMLFGFYGSFCFHCKRRWDLDFGCCCRCWFMIIILKKTYFIFVTYLGCRTHTHIYSLISMVFTLWHSVPNNYYCLCKSHSQKREINEWKAIEYRIIKTQNSYASSERCEESPYRATSSSSHKLDVIGTHSPYYDI